MDTSNFYIISNLKKELILAIIHNQFNLLSPEVLTISKQLDVFMNPLFKDQLINYSTNNLS